MCAGLRYLLGCSHHLVVVAHTTQVHDVAVLCAYHQPQVLLLDVGLVDQQLAFLAELPHTRVLLWGEMLALDGIQSWFAQGAWGYMLRTEDEGSILAGVLAVAHKRRWISNDIAGPSTDWRGNARLSPCETAVLKLLVQGFDNRQVAETLGIAPQTVRNRLTKMYPKLGVCSRTQAALWFRTYHM